MNDCPFCYNSGLITCRFVMTKIIEDGPYLTCACSRSKGHAGLHVACRSKENPKRHCVGFCDNNLKQTIKLKVKK